MQNIPGLKLLNSENFMNLLSQIEYIWVLDCWSEMKSQIMTQNYINKIVHVHCKLYIIF